MASHQMKLFIRIVMMAPLSLDSHEEKIAIDYNVENGIPISHTICILCSPTNFQLRRPTRNNLRKITSHQGQLRGFLEEKVSCWLAVKDQAINDYDED
jgi:hypothetical protein